MFIVDAWFSDDVSAFFPFNPCILFSMQFGDAAFLFGKYQACFLRQHYSTLRGPRSSRYMIPCGGQPHMISAVQTLASLVVLLENCQLHVNYEAQLMEQKNRLVLLLPNRFVTAVMAVHKQDTMTAMMTMRMTMRMIALVTTNSPRISMITSHIFLHCSSTKDQRKSPPPPRPPPPFHPSYSNELSQMKKVELMHYPTTLLFLDVIVVDVA